MPQWTDQPTNAKFIVDVWKVGVRIKLDERGIATKEEIELCIREVIEGERGKQMKMNSVRWKELAKEAVDKGGSFDKNIEEFVAKPAILKLIWNSTLEALSLAVPMVAMPQWTDQPTNAKFIVDVWKVGVRIKLDERGIATKEEIELCIREVIEGERGKQMKMNSVRWKELAKEAVDKGGSFDKNIEEFVAKPAILKLM
nr:udp-glycosyltransferase 74c1 [Quercus suber]